MAARRRPEPEQEPALVAGIALTHPDRVLFPEQGITKRELARYHETVADWILPELAGRPLSLVRCPQGRRKACFFQRHPGATVPDRVETVAIPGEPEPYLAVRDLPGLIALVQIGVLELHPWPARAATPEHPDRLILDLDPGEGAPFEGVVAAARIAREMLTGLGLASFVKTTGGRGLHVVVPLASAHGWAAHQAAAKTLAERLAATAPDRLTTAIRKAERRGRIFVDWLRNARGASAVAPYSPRARTGAPVAMPLAWDELGPGLDPATFTVRTVPGLLRNRPDPWAGIASLRQALPEDL
ncbi:non-homologous end-joining DNA ligase [Benzoatithermus flavus]|uniref:Non-homologous end-joining DNA ligase n=1 Tax=Benzoatithermus flavus TaxID=3108223 RepID=A0ABU8XN74_9PROT